MIQWQEIIIRVFVDDDFIFYMCGIIRKEAADLLYQNRNNTIIRSFVKSAIDETLLEQGAFYDYIAIEKSNFRPENHSGWIDQPLVHDEYHNDLMFNDYVEFNILKRKAYFH